MREERDLTWDYVAKSLEDLVQIGDDVLTAPTQKDLDEQLQTLWLLKAAAAQGLLAYPVCVKHTGRISARPDFKVLSGSRRISLECSKIMTSSIGHAEALQRRGLVDLPLRRLDLLDPKERWLSDRDLINRAFLTPQEVFPPTLTTVDQMWQELFDRTLERKLELLERPDFPHSDADWLVLWDRTGSQPWQMQRRVATIRTSLAPTWRRRHSFEHVFILAEDFSWISAWSQNSTGTAA